MEHCINEVCFTTGSFILNPQTTFPVTNCSPTTNYTRKRTTKLRHMHRHYIYNIFSIHRLIWQLPVKWLMYVELEPTRTHTVVLWEKTFDNSPNHYYYVNMKRYDKAENWFNPNGEYIFEVFLWSKPTDVACRTIIFIPHCKFVLVHVCCADIRFDMPCEACNAQFTVFKRKRSCSECRFVHIKYALLCTFCVRNVPIEYGKLAENVRYASKCGSTLRMCILMWTCTSCVTSE